MTIKIYPYKQGSRSARTLADALGSRVLKLEGSTWRPRVGDFVINWGSSTGPQLNGPVVVLNRPQTVSYAANKLNFFNALQNNNLTPQYWTNPDEIPDEAFPIVCRTILSGHSGAGIVISNNREELVDARLYVKYEKKLDEYRIHVGFDRQAEEPNVISVQRKAIRNGAENVNHQIRNLANGYVFVRVDVNPPEAVISAAKEALSLLDLDFGAVDVIWNNRRQQAYVLEVNCAPGLEGQTVQDYVQYFERNCW